MRYQAQHRSERPWWNRTRIAACVSVLSGALLVGGGSAFATQRTTVTLDVNGVSRPITTWGDSVGSVLQQAGVTLAVNDMVSPNVNERVADGSTVVVRSAHPLAVTIDGHERTVWTTADSLDGVLAALRDSGRDVAVPASRGDTRESITPLLTQPAQVTVVDGSRQVKVEGEAGDDVDRVLARARIEVSPIDEVSLTGGRRGPVVTVTRVTRGVTRQRGKVRFTERQQQTGDLFAGERVVTVKGRAGSTTTYVWQEAHDGTVVYSSPLDLHEKTDAVQQVVRVGTKPVTPLALIKAGIDPKAKLERSVDAQGRESVRYRAKLGSLSTPAQIAAYQQQGIDSTSSGEAAGSSSTTPSEAQDIAQAMVAARGWDNDEFQCLVTLWNHESGWSVTASNPSGAYGIPQALPGSKMSSAGSDWRTNPTTQISWGLGYIASRYGSPCAALAHWNSAGSY